MLRPATPPAVTDDTPPLLAALHARRSIGPRGLADPAPPPEALQRAADLAWRAPDHQALRPVRFVHVGADERAALADLFARAAAAQGRDAEGVAQARARAFTGPALLAVVARIRDDVPDVPPHEQWLTVGAAVMNLLHALHLQGFAAKVLGGSAARSDIVQRAFCHAGEQLACWVIAGTAATGAQAPDPAAPARDGLTDWTPPPV